MSAPPRSDPDQAPSAAPNSAPGATPKWEEPTPALNADSATTLSPTQVASWRERGFALMSWQTIGHADARIVADLKFRRQVEHLHRLGPQAIGHFLAELGVDELVLSKLEGHLDRYEQLDPEVVAAVGGKDWPPNPMTMIDGGRR